MIRHKLFRGLLASLLLLSGVSCSKTAPAGYTINGEINGTEGKIYLSVFEGKIPVRIDSTESVNGLFTFTGQRDVPILAAIETPDQILTRFFLDNSPITIRGAVSALGQIQVSGSPTNDEYNRYKGYADSVTALLYNDSIAATGKRATDSMFRLVNVEKLNYVQNHPASVVSAYVLYRELSYTMGFEELKTIVKGFDASVQPSIYVTMVRTMADALEKTAVGTHYTDFTLPDTQGNPLALSSLVGEGKYVLVQFWASWCPPCRAESPNLVVAHSEYSGRGLEILSVSLDKTKDAWLKGISDLKLNWKHVSEVKFWNSQAAEIYGVRSIPANVLIGPDGTILARNLEGEDLLNKLAELMPAPERKTVAPTQK